MKNRDVILKPVIPKTMKSGNYKHPRFRIKWLCRVVFIHFLVFAISRLNINKKPRGFYDLLDKMADNDHIKIDNI